MHQMDVNIKLVNEMIEEEVYIEHPEGFGTLNKESHVCTVWTKTNTPCLL